MADTDRARAARETQPTPGSGSGLRVTVRYWAGARAAAGVVADELEVAGTTTLADVVRRVRALHPDPAFARVVGVCSTLIDDRPVGTRDAGAVVVEPGSTVELLPPFAGG